MLDSTKLGSKIKIALAITIGMVLMMFIAIFLVGSKEFLEVVQPKIHIIFFKLFAGITIFSAIASYTISLLNKYSFERDSWKRWAIELLVLIFTVTVISVLKSKFQPDHHVNSIFDTNNTITAFAMFNISMGVLIFMVYEIWTVLEDNQKLTISLASSEKDKLALQLSSLQQKLNPHFLFNSLNVLSELMYEDTEKANEFINQFSKVYRYVLDINDQSFVSLKKEVEFLESYLFLQKIRFGDKLIVNIDLSPKVLNTYAPPLAFQLLLENAIKHNQATKKSPLVVNITNDEKYLIVKNNIQLRDDVNNSTGVGHSNLKSTYSFFSGLQPQFIQSENEYIAMLPILEKLP
ncbi:sensor histidine kinase [Portibacter lacus]|uniref:Signal transduction histidine kinase internal region domain-containing protein n=1 Tax=Portibacter lacus TaxID=1099794 RepID=A0AA37SSJ4_9BACT|nr:histidine kinase [Portibacter lacus]GLR19658.1 hypothetical protein GCM10007940_42740 [Portibacter lacus]